MRLWKHRKERIVIKGMRYPVVITKWRMKCHDREETHEIWRRMDPHRHIKSDNARAWWLQYGPGLLALCDRFSEKDMKEYER